MKVFPSYTSGDKGTDNVTTVNRAYINGIIDPISTFIDSIKGVSQATIANADSPYTIPSNSINQLNVNCHAGNVVINLPDCASQTNSIKIKKIDTTNNTITINRVGSDTINNYYDTRVTPFTTSFGVYFSGEWYEFNPRTNGSTVWETVDGYLPTAYTSFLAKVTFTKNFTSEIPSLIRYDDDSTPPMYDYSSSFDAASHRYRAKVNGLYSFFATATSNTGNAGEYLGVFSVNGNERILGDRNEMQAGNHDMSIGNDIILDINDYVDVRVYHSGTQNVAGSVSNSSSFFGGRLIQRLS